LVLLSNTQNGIAIPTIQPYNHNYIKTVDTARTSVSIENKSVWELDSKTLK